MVGAFHQPVAVVSDVATLDTLPDRELRAGLAEVIKHGAALDAAFFAWLEAHIGELLARERAALIHAVRRSCELKAAIVAEDEREFGRRALLNLGHTFGHAIEAATGFGPWLHGEAVAAGMVLAAELSARAGLLRAEEAQRLVDLIRRAGLPTRAPALAAARWHELMALDKKSAAGRLRFVLLEGLGRAQLHGGVDPRLVDEVLVAAAQ
jgi:3-dehydroquinate synthase